MVREGFWQEVPLLPNQEGWELARKWDGRRCKSEKVLQAGGRRELGCSQTGVRDRKQERLKPEFSAGDPPDQTCVSP